MKLRKNKGAEKYAKMSIVILYMEEIFFIPVFKNNHRNFFRVFSVFRGKKDFEQNTQMTRSEVI